MTRLLNRRKTASWFAIAILLLGWVGAAAYWSTHQLVLSFDSVSQTHVTLEKLQAIQLMMESAESSVLSFVITAQEDRLVDFYRAQKGIPRKLRQVQAIVGDNSKLKKPLKRLSGLVSTRLAGLGDIVDSRNLHGLDAAAPLVAAENQSLTRETIAALLADVQKEETILLARGATSTTRRSEKAKGVLAGSGVVCFGLLIFVFGRLNRESDGRYLAERATARMETFLDSIVERIPYMILVKEASHLRLMRVNKAAAEWFGRTEEELLGSNEFDLRPRAEAYAVMESDHAALREGKPVDIPEERLVLPGQEERILHTQKIVIPDDNGHPAYLLTISEDITQRKQAERMLQLSRDAAVESARLKSEFLRNMSHELRTPLAIIMGMNALLLDTQLADDQRLFASKVQKASDGLAKLTKDILDFSKIECGTFALESQEFNVTQTVDSVVTMLSEQAKVKGLNLVRLVYSDIPATVLGDAVRLRQVLAQLIGNAVKFTSKGEVLIRVTEERASESQIWLNFRVNDTGIGIQPEVQKHMFEIFRQGDGSHTRRYGGTGLGLAMSKRIVELMGGDIGFESTDGQGSSFWITLPFQKRHMRGPSIQVTTLPWARARILVVDENETSRQWTRQQLGTLGLASEGVASGSVAMDMLRREKSAGRPFPVVLVDMDVADMDSVAFARGLKADPALSGTHVLVLTMPGAPLESSTAASLGFAGFLTKPPAPDALHQALAALIEPQTPERRQVA